MFTGTLSIQHTSQNPWCLHLVRAAAQAKGRNTTHWGEKATMPGSRNEGLADQDAEEMEPRPHAKKVEYRQRRYKPDSN